MSAQPSKALPPLLAKINSPQDVKDLSFDELDILATEIRSVLINSLSQTGGHLGPNLGVVELTIALHRVFDTPRDHFVFDVSHQSYIHKMLTGRAAEIHTIRQYQGLNGFTLRTESEHDCFGAGHAGTALSAALGMATARDLRGDPDHVVAVAGDAAFTCGVTFEALNNIATNTKRMITVLNDNEWSIDRNVGAIAKYFNTIATHPTYSGLHEKAANFLEKIAGKNARRFAGKIEETAKNLLAIDVPSVLFEEFGIRYYGPIDGHHIPTLVRTFEFLRDQNEPCILHIITEKGRGYTPAIGDPMKFHGLGPYKTETGETPASGTPTFSQIFGRTVTDMAKADERIVAITGAMPNGTGLTTFRDELPERYFDVGIAEEHAALFAAGMATKGLRPFLAIYSTFMQRAYDMLVHDIGIQNLPVRLCMDRAGLSGDDGPTHHGLFDIGYLSHIPNFIFCSPRDEAIFVDMLHTLADYDNGPSAIRYPRGAGNGAHHNGEPKKIPIGEAEVIHDGDTVALLGLGSLFDTAAELHRTLTERGISTALIDPRWIKPLDTEVIEKYARRCRLLVTLEDHVRANGFGSIVATHLYDKGIHTPLLRIGWPDEFIEHGNIPKLRAQHHLDHDSILEQILATFES